MYLVLTWSPAPSQSAATVKADIAAIVAGHAFVNRYDAFDGHLVANVAPGATRDAIVALSADLNLLAPGRFSYVAYYVPKGHFAWHSSDLSRQQLDAIATF